MSNKIKYYNTLISLFLASSPFTYANTFGDIEVGLVNDDNLTRAD